MKKAVCCFLALVFLLCASVFCFADTVPAAETSSAHKPAPTPKAAPSTPSPSPWFPENGEVILAPDYEGVGEVKIIADEETDYYVYFEYVGEPELSSTSRELAEDAEAPYESDLAFFVKAGRTVKKKIPVGVYKFYYASGEVFFGKEELFGDTTNCSSAEELLQLYTDENGYFIQYTIELCQPSDIYFATEDVSREDFPNGSANP